MNPEDKQERDENESPEAPMDNAADPQAEASRADEAAKEDVPVIDREVVEDAPIVDASETPAGESPFTVPGFEEVKVEQVPATTSQTGQSDYTLWEKINPIARRKKQMNQMQAGYNEILGLVQSIRTNMDYQVEAQKKMIEVMHHLPEAVDGLKDLSKTAAEHTDMMKIMQGSLDSNLEHNKSMATSVDKFNDTLVSMDSTTKTIVDHQRQTEQELRQMLVKSERRMAGMTFLLIIMLLGAIGILSYVAFQDKIDAFFAERSAQPADAPAVAPTPAPTELAPTVAPPPTLAPTVAAPVPTGIEEAPLAPTAVPEPTVPQDEDPAGIKTSSVPMPPVVEATPLPTPKTAVDTPEEATNADVPALPTKLPATVLPTIEADIPPTVTPTVAAEAAPEDTKPTDVPMPPVADAAPPPTAEAATDTPHEATTGEAEGGSEAVVEPVPLPTPSPAEVAPEPTPLPEPTATAVPTATPLPTPTPAPTATPTPVPTATPLRWLYDGMME